MGDSVPMTRVHLTRVPRERVRVTSDDDAVQEVALAELPGLVAAREAETGGRAPRWVWDDTARW